MTRNLICMIGLPCSGKSTIAKKLADNIKAKYISTGDIARSLIKTPTEAAETASNDRYAGEAELRKALKNKIETYSGVNIILDGFPRFAEQAEYLLSEFNYDFPIVIEINAGGDSTLINRAFLRKRDQSDDMDQFTKRLAAAKTNLNDIHKVMQKNLQKVYTIMDSSNSMPDAVQKQFERILKDANNIRSRTN